VGSSGAGKSHLAIALGFTACRQGMRVRLIGVTDLITQLMEAREDCQSMRVKWQLTKHDLLIFDKPGYDPDSKVGSPRQN